MKGQVKMKTIKSSMNNKISLVEFPSTTTLDLDLPQFKLFNNPLTPNLEQTLLVVEQAWKTPPTDNNP